MDRFESRARECQRRLDDGDVVVLPPGPNLYYLTGFWAEQRERHLLVVLPAAGEPTAVVPELYAEQLAETWVEDHRTWADDGDPRELLADVLGELSPDRLLVDPRTWARFTLDLRAAAPDATVGLAEEVLTELRIHKDDGELAALRRAADVADAVARDVRALGPEAVGTTERDLARRVERELAERGGEELAFDVVVAAGPNGARPHHDPGDREIATGDPVVLDFGTRVDQYPSDQTRTVVFDGEPPDGFREAFAAVRTAQSAAVEAVEPGVPAGEVDRAARSVLAERGFGAAFVHRTGHGVGLDVHEEPYVAADSDRELEPGMVFSVEPGVYREGAFGVRIEDLVVVTETGCERLNDSPRGWRPGA
jgi:Xaa-Pro aminopeptidase